MPWGQWHSFSVLLPIFVRAGGLNDTDDFPVIPGIARPTLRRQLEKDPAPAEIETWYLARPLTPKTRPSRRCCRSCQTCPKIPGGWVNCSSSSPHLITSPVTILEPGNFPGPVPAPLTWLSGAEGAKVFQASRARPAVAAEAGQRISGTLGGLGIRTDRRGFPEILTLAGGAWTDGREPWILAFNIDVNHRLEPTRPLLLIPCLGHLSPLSVLIF